MPGIYDASARTVRQVCVYVCVCVGVCVCVCVTVHWHALLISWFQGSQGGLHPLCAWHL